MIVLGIDTGLTGALAWVNSDTGDLLRIVDMPVTQIGGQNCVSARHLIAELRVFDHPDRTFIEVPAPRPIKMHNHATGQTESHIGNPFTMLSMGISFGVACAVCDACSIPFNVVAPKIWKPVMAVAKGMSCAAAQHYFPRQAETFARKKDDGRADAAMIALYGIRMMRR